MAGEFFNNSIEGFEKLLAQLEKLKSSLKEIADNQKKAVSGVNPAEAKAEDIKELDNATKKLIKTEEELVKVSKEEVKIGKKIKDLKTEEGKRRVEANLILSDEKKKAKEAAKERLGLTNAYQKESKRLNDLRNKYKNLAIQNKENSKVAKEYLKDITKTDAKLKAIDKSVGQNFRSVGDYKGAISSLTPILGTFGSKLNSIQMGLSSAKEGFQKLIPAQKGAAKSSKLLKIAMLSIPIFAIIGAITALIAVFAGTQRGMDAITKVTRPLKAVFDALLGVVEQLAFDGFDALKEAISNPMQALKDLGNIIKENVINRFKSFLVLGEAVSLMLDGEWKAAMKKGADAFIQFNTGVTNGTDRLDKWGRKVAEVVVNAIEIGGELDNLIKQFEKLELKSLVPIAKLKIEFQQLKQIANDQLKTDEERIKALEDAEKVQRQISANERKLLSLKIEAMELQHNINDTSREDDKELQLLLVERLNFEEKAQKKIAGLISLKTGIQLRAINKQIAADIAEAKRIQELADLEAERRQAAIDGVLEEWELKKKLAQEEIDLVNEVAEEEDIVTHDLLKKQIAERKAAAQKRREEEIQFAKDVTGIAGEELQKRINNQKEALNQEENLIKDNITRQQALADKGLANQVAFEKQKLKEKQREILENEKKEAQLKEAIRLGELFLTLKEAEAKEKVQGSTARALSGVAEAKATVETIKAGLTAAGFAEGGYTGDGGKYEEAGIVHKGEFVIDKETTAQMGLRGKSMKDLDGVLSMHEMRREGIIKANKDKTYTKEMLKALLEIKNKPIQQVDVDGLGNVIETITDGSIKRVTKLKTRGRL